MFQLAARLFERNVHLAANRFTIVIQQILVLLAVLCFDLGLLPLIRPIEDDIDVGGLAESQKVLLVRSGWRREEKKWKYM